MACVGGQTVNLVVKPGFQPKIILKNSVNQFTVGPDGYYLSKRSTIHELQRRAAHINSDWFIDGLQMVYRPTLMVSIDGLLTKSSAPKIFANTMQNMVS